MNIDYKFKISIITCLVWLSLYLWPSWALFPFVVRLMEGLPLLVLALVKPSLVFFNLFIPGLFVLGIWNWFWELLNYPQIEAHGKDDGEF